MAFGAGCTKGKKKIPRLKCGEPSRDRAGRELHPYPRRRALLQYRGARQAPGGALEGAQRRPQLPRRIAGWAPRCRRAPPPARRALGLLHLLDRAAGERGAGGRPAAPLPVPGGA